MLRQLRTQFWNGYPPARTDLHSTARSLPESLPCWPQRVVHVCHVFVAYVPALRNWPRHRTSLSKASAACGSDGPRARNKRSGRHSPLVCSVVARGALIDRDCALVQRAPPLRQHGKACLETLDAVAGSSAFTSHARRSDGLLAKISSLPRDEYQVAAGCFQSESLELVRSTEYRL